MENARTEPTDRSMPPITITAVMPIARIPRTVTWSENVQQVAERKERASGKRKDDTKHSPGQ